MKVIGIDIGTTSICGVVLDAENGKVLKSKNVNSEAFIDTHNEWEKIQDTYPFRTCGGVKLVSI